MVDLSDKAELRRSIELFYFGYRAFTMRPDRILERRGLGRAHHRILYFIGRDPGTPVSGLLRTLEISKQALNAPLRQLVAMKLVVSETATYDQRIKLLNLTEAGRALEAQLTGAQMRHLADAFRAVGRDAGGHWRAVMAALLSEP
jgi:DNA-binding MarR family transcriptional regulator